MMIYWTRYNWSPFNDSTINTLQRLVNKALCWQRPTNVRLHLLTLILWPKRTKRLRPVRLRCSRPSLWKTSLEASWDQDSSLENHNCVSPKKSPPEVYDFFHFFHKRLRIFNRFFTHYYTFPCTIDYKFLFNYLQLWRSYTILSTTT